MSFSFDLTNFDKLGMDDIIPFKESAMANNGKIAKDDYEKAIQVMKESFQESLKILEMLENVEVVDANDSDESYDLLNDII